MRYFEKRSAPDHAWTLACYAAAAVIAFLATAAMLKLFGGQPVKAFSGLVSGAVGSERAIYGTLAQATPIFLIGIGTAVAFRANLWNIGQEGQVIAGAIAGYWASLALTGTPLLVSMPVVVLASMGGGGLVAAISAILRTRFDISEILSTVMISYLVYYLLLYLLDGGPWMERGTTVTYRQSPPLDPSLEWPVLAGAGSSEVHIGFILGLVVAVLVSVMLQRMPVGVEIRAMAENPTAALYRGLNVNRLRLMVLALSGAIIGLAGAGQLFGDAHRLGVDTFFGLGTMGIVVAMVGGARPGGILVAALFIGGLQNGALYMRLKSSTPSGIVSVMEGLVLLMFLIAAVAVRYKIRRPEQNA